MSMGTGCMDPEKAEEWPERKTPGAQRWAGVGSRSLESQEVQPRGVQMGMVSKAKCCRGHKKDDKSCGLGRPR